MLAAVLVTFVMISMLLLAMQSQAPYPAPHPPSHWARVKLPEGSYRVETQGGRERIVLWRAFTLQGVPLAADSEVQFHRMTGGLARGTLSHDARVDGILCRGGSTVSLMERPARLRLVRFTPAEPLLRWGLRCGADEEVDLEWRTGTLADDHVYEHFTLPAGSSFQHHEDWGDLSVTLARPIEVMGHRLPKGSIVSPHPRHAPGTGGLAGWICRHWPWSDRAELLRTFNPSPFWIGEAQVAELGWVVIKADGLAEIDLGSDHVATGVRYPAESTIVLDAEGRVHGWRAGPAPHREPRRGPYRSARGA